MSAASGVVLSARGVCADLGGREVLTDVDLDVRAGTLVVVVGPNGAGKSTLLGVLSGDLPVSSGAVELDGRSLAGWSPADLARRRAVLSQAQDVSFGFTVREVVAMGRYPWTGRDEIGDDERVVAESLRRTDPTHLADRAFRTLSGGERARASLARVLAQDTDLVLLDEPTAALDLRHTEEVLAQAKAIARSGRTVVVVAHDLSLSSAYADELVVVDGGRVVAHGAPVDVLTPELVERTYGLAVDVHPLGGRLVVVPRPVQIVTSGHEDHDNVS